MKSVSKVGLAILKDLILRLQQAGPRASLAEPLDWEGADNEWVFFFGNVFVRFVSNSFNQLGYSILLSTTPIHGSLIQYGDAPLSQSCTTGTLTRPSTHLRRITLGWQPFDLTLLPHYRPLCAFSLKTPHNLSKM